MSPQIVISETCPYCSRPRSPRDMIRFTSHNICQDCYRRHEKAMAALTSGNYAGGCSECGKSQDEIAALQGGGDKQVRMVVHFEGGIYRPMCLSCDRAYVPKRRDLYGGTRFWNEQGL